MERSEPCWETHGKSRPHLCFDGQLLGSSLEACMALQCFRVKPLHCCCTLPAACQMVQVRQPPNTWKPD